MLPDDLAIKDSSGSTALHTAAHVGNIEAATLLIQRNPNLAIVLNNDNELPLHVAAKYGQGEMVLHLLPITKEDAEPKPFEEESGAKLLCGLIDSGLYDIALSFLQQYPKLSSASSPVEPSPLESIAREPSAFRSGARLNICQRLIYYFDEKSLALFISYSNNAGERWDMWLMNEYGKVESWTK
ncbi:Ankyrin repeat family protein [Abeliophyllum distichum]|uniref:Ankyrin repeat family protein n=1 Tax=Abeliophyllum distichum TaxID=126358 RepID=A0ABD1NTI8_9LAMI